MLQKALLSVTARERAQLWGFRLSGRWGIIQKALISAMAHEYMQKPFDFAIFGRQWRVCDTGQVSVTKRAAFRKGIYAKLYESCEDSAKRPHFNSRRN